MKHCALLMLYTLVLTSMGCAGPFVMKPPGDEVARCSGYMRLERGARTRFSVHLYRNDSEFDVYATIPGERVRYRRVEVMNFEDNGLYMEFDSGKKIFGEFTGDELEFDGRWKDMKGSFTLELN